MIGITLISHGKMAEGMRDSMVLILGETEQITTVSLCAGEDFEQFQATIFQKIKTVDDGAGVLVFVDLYGASPYNAAMLSIQKAKEAGIALRIVTGMNLSMLLEIAGMRTAELPLAELSEIAVRSGRSGIQEAVIEQISETESEDDY